MRKKFLRFQDNQANPRFLETPKPLFDTIKGQWHPEFFSHPYPIVLELGCGTGTYAVTLAQAHPDRNFIGVDIKGSRMWVGSQESQEKNLSNIGFLRTRIEDLEKFFAPQEVEEIYITFPDPRPKEREAKKRLTSERFLDLYSRIISPQGRIHLKTDSLPLYHFTQELIKKRNYPILVATDHLYKTHPDSLHTRIQTTYEKRFLAEGKPITYLCFSFPR